MKHIKSVFVLAMLFLLFIPHRSALLWSLNPRKPLGRFLLETFNPANRFPSYSAYSMAQTPDGYLWIAGGKNLFRFDGWEFESFPLGEKGRDDFTILKVDREGMLWIGGFSQLYKYNYKNQSFIDLGKSLSDQQPFSGHTFVLFAMFPDLNGTLWFSEKNSLYYLKDSVVVHAGTMTAPILSIMEDSRGNIWLGGYTGGLQYIRDNKPVRYSNLRLNSSPSIFSIIEDSRGILWLATDNGLYGIINPPGSVNNRSEELNILHINTENGLNDNRVFHFYEDSSGVLWASTRKGVNRVIVSGSPGSGQYSFRTVPFLDGQHILYTFEDREKSLWIGTLGLGLNRLRDSTFSNLKSNVEFSKYRPALFQAPEGSVFIGAFGGKIIRIKDGKSMTWLAKKGEEYAEITAMEWGSDQTLWVGTTSGRLMNLSTDKPGIQKDLNLALHSHLSPPIWNIYRDSSQRLWIGTSAGLFCLRQPDWKPVIYTTRNGLPSVSVMQTYEDRQGHLWVCTERGLVCYRNGDFNNPAARSTYLDGTLVLGLLEDKDQPGVFWLGTAGKGLQRLKNKQLFEFTPQHGVNSRRVYQILEDNRENLWLSTLDGIIKLSKKDLHSIADSERTTGSQKVRCRDFGKSDGLETAQCWFRSTNSAIKTHTGEMWFSTLHGIAVVNPDNIIINKYPPPVVIKEIYVNGNPVIHTNHQKSHIFKGLKTIMFQFRALTFVSKERVKFKYKLEGADEDWQESQTGEPRTAVYRNLPPGQFTFRVIACNSSSVWNTEGSSFTFTYKLYFYQTTWFKVLIVICLLAMAAALFFAVRRFRELRKIANKYKHSTLDPADANKHLKELQYLLEQEKIYQDESISLASLAEKMDIQARHLSQLINEKMNLNFWDMIHQYRIEAAKQMLANSIRDKEKPSILEICYEVGFNSKTSFYRAFKKFTGLTPSEFVKKNNQT